MQGRDIGLPAFNGETNQAGAAAIGARLRRLSERIDRDAGRLYAEAGIDFEQRWFGVINLLALLGPRTVGELASFLGVSHASVSQVRAALERAELTIWNEHPGDRRQRWLQLSAKGENLVARLTPLWKALITAALEINEEADDALAALERLETVLSRVSLYSRVKLIMDGNTADIAAVRP